MRNDDLDVASTAIKIPNINDGFALEVKILVGAVRDAEDKSITSRNHLVNGEKLIVSRHVRVGGEDTFRLKVQELLKFIAQRRSSVVVIGFERHAQEPNSLILDLVFFLEGVGNVEDEALIDVHRGMAEAEVIL